MLRGTESPWSVLISEHTDQGLFIASFIVMLMNPADFSHSFYRNASNWGTFSPFFGQTPEISSHETAAEFQLSTVCFVFFCKEPKN